MKKISLVNNAWMLLVVIVFGIIYQFSSTYAYVDGDDATSIAYHLLGRDKTLQPPYSPYHGMMDKLLSILPAEEKLVRTVAFRITRYANILMVVITLLLSFNWLQSFGENYLPSGSRRILISVIVLFAIPELFYLGLVYSPTQLAMCFVLSAHLILRWAYLGETSKRTRLISYIGALVLFGLGVSFRWNVVAYGLVIVTDLTMIQPMSESIKNRLLIAMIWGVFALISSLIMINFSGYGLSDIGGMFGIILYVINQAGTLSPGDDVSFKEILMRTGLTLSPLLSPVLILFVLAGLIKLILNRSKFIFVILAGFLGILPWVRTGVPKFIITFLPILVFTLVLGFVVVLDFIKQKRYRVIIYAFLIIGLVFPWLIGIHVDREGTAWGPGFELKPYTYTDISDMNFQVAFSSGMAFPTPEGPRALYGHGYVLFGMWNKFVNSDAAERQNIIDTAISLDLPLVVTSWSPDYYLDNLYSMGFKTSDAANHMAADGYFIERRFDNSQGKTISVLFHEVEKTDIPELISDLEQYPNLQKFALIGYPQTMRTLYESDASALQALGRTSAIADLTQLKIK
jgi:hypothetical protein